MSMTAASLRPVWSGPAAAPASVSSTSSTMGGAAAAYTPAAPVEARDGPAGTLVAVRRDPQTGAPRYLLVRQPRFFGLASQVRLVPASWVSEARADRIILGASRAAVARCPVAWSDAALQRAVLRELRREPILHPFRDTFQVEVQDGVATLKGYVKSPGEARVAEQRALEVPGIAGVRNELVIDEELEARVAGALLNDPRTHEALVIAESWLGCVTLTGRASSEAARQQATEIARAVPGVREVRNLLAVDPTPPPEWLFCPHATEQQRVLA